MSLRSRCAIAIAVSALVTTAATAVPAVADDDWGQGQSNTSEQNQSSDPGQNQSGNAQQNQGGDGGHSDNQRFSRGIVTASSLALRSAPTRGSQVIRYASRGEILSIFCKTRGEDVQGDPVWYQIADDIWAWGAARYIDIVGRTPRWC
jgi:hypothetical protein